ncbi:hypothetical protein NX059_000652 [Plenodomus lindquistii]|nr:hypothetical protein NX059_000652 [Plenodomus lindquistii]
MVYYFSSNTVTPSAFIYVGKDKVENEELIKYGWEEDVWFHADNLSSAHIYVRLPEGESWENMNKNLMIDCAQLTKANSIEGNKKDNVTVVYTPWSNLKKDGSMAVGQVGFKDQRKVKRIHVEQRENPIVNRLNKTKVEKFPDLKEEREARQRELRKRDRDALQAKVCYRYISKPLFRFPTTPFGSVRRLAILFLSFVNLPSEAPHDLANVCCASSLANELSMLCQLFFDMINRSGHF